MGYLIKDFNTFAIDCGSPEFEDFAVGKGGLCSEFVRNETCSK